ncbi:hypothetical protein PZT66_30085 [Pseudomonas aeruginosa]|uniref:hypothetical protein n=1 Tax=Pseudomonas aeruginosa TaxID=287 RepID=UPI0009372F7E|nr:hypothetical protein [Pseudomonas aeruginosa]EKJ8518409.1 hypothetical protein [Pseudomonas aeruginosa]ELK7310557.1 hypothetical protein [Pseudomonas aeruginosa]ELP0277997.1 hypothetical protein [Pseudomonas aeruginosa]MBG4804900.1 hypothetical protein [Pseudomonas aeruginosa]MBG5032777.1 hypothetical protein [Pseudomonas aeruginosa]
MAETDNIAKMAEILSDELFSEFMWNRVGPFNRNWACEERESHKVDTHPSDVVFWYEEPYSIYRTYVNCDLKSYKKETITTEKVKAAVVSLANSLGCAEKSIDWQSEYTHPHVSKKICGLLFIYNHDGRFDADFSKRINVISPESLSIPKGSKLVVMGPDDIRWLINVKDEIVRMRGLQRLPPREQCEFYYPHLVRKNNLKFDKAPAATLEMLTSSWFILRASFEKGGLKNNYVVFYRRKGYEVAEFLYLLDCLAHYQILVAGNAVGIKILSPHESAAAKFQLAVDEYAERCGGGEMEKILKDIKFEKMSKVTQEFSEVEIGMRDE